VKKEQKYLRLFVSFISLVNKKQENASGIHGERLDGRLRQL
jgi:hypothetical protein